MNMGFTLPLIFGIAAVLLLVAAFVIFRLIVRRDYQQKGRLTIVSVLLEVLIFALHANFSYLYIPAIWPALPSLPGNLVLKVVGLSFVGLGLVIAVIAMTGLGFRRSFGQQGDRVRQTGLYGITRNPQIVGYGTAVVGYAVLWPSWYALGWVALYGVLAHMMVLTEEEYLRQVYGEAYLTFCERVPRYVPFPGRKRGCR